MCGDSGNSFFEELVNITVNAATLGAAGYGDNQGGISFDQGLFGRPVKSALKDITGASAAEEANDDARARFEEEKRRAQQARENAKKQNARDALVQARSAQAARGRTQTTAGGTTTQISNLGSEERDFLGL